MTTTNTQDGFIRSGMVRFHEDLEPLMRPIDSVKPAPYNYNNGDVDLIAESIETNGMYRPIYVQRSTGHIIAGNHTWMACKQLGADSIPFVVLDVSDVEAKRLMVTDNETARHSQPDSGLLLALLSEIEEAEGDVRGSGMTDQDVEVLRHLNEIPLEHDEFGQWPTFTVKLPPHVLRAFMNMTREADDDRSRFELLLRLAGWDGSAEE